MLLVGSLPGPLTSKSSRVTRFFRRHVRHVASVAASVAYRPRRAVLYVPGNDEKKISKISSLNVDCVVLDCEDGVALNRKVEARNTTRRTLDAMNFSKTECVVRVNSVSSKLLEEDLSVILQAKCVPSGLMLPKVDTVQELEQFSDLLQQMCSQMPHLTDYKPGLITMVESAWGLLNLESVLKRAAELSGKGVFTLEAVTIGSDDLCADIGATRTTEGNELLYARQKVLIAAKAYQLQAIDMVHIDYKSETDVPKACAAKFSDSNFDFWKTETNLESLKQVCNVGAGMGFTGKQVIHPGQIEIVQNAFSPSDAKIYWAKHLIEAFEEHQKSGKGAFTFQGRMVDMPLLLQAKNVTRLAQSIQK